MHDAKQRGKELFLVVASGDTYVLRHAAAERMSTNVNPAAVEVKAEQLHHAQAQLTLGVDIERTLRDQARLLLLFGDHLLQ
ncbi:hypothetical protein D3C80_1586370 [compost metagenome]